MILEFDLQAKVGRGAGHMLERKLHEQVWMGWSHTVFKKVVFSW